MTSSAFFTCAAANANTSALQLVRGAVDVTRVGKQVGRAPEQLDAGALLFFLQDLDDGVEVPVRLGKGLAFGRDVAVVEGIERRAEFFDELERGARAVLGVADGIGAVIPRTDHGADAERVAAGARNVCQ